MVLILSFAPENRKSHCSGCMTVTDGALVANLFCILGLIFLLKFLLKSISKLFFFSALVSGSSFGAAVSAEPAAVARSSFAFCSYCL